MKRHWRSMCFITAFCGVATSRGEYRQLSSVHDGSGVMSTNTVTLGPVAYRHVSAASQPGGIFTSTNGAIVNHAGFLQAVDIKRPGLDTDGDGVIDELSTDNDGDALTDGEEIEGSEFDPATATLVNNPDTDGDNVPDGQEASAGTDPTDEDAFLQITALENRGGDKALWWTARDGKQYRILSADGNHAYPTNVEGTVTAAGGAAPWFETISGFTNAGATGARSYGVHVLP
jgi:hypothetical protein